MYKPLAECGLCADTALARASWQKGKEKATADSDDMAVDPKSKKRKADDLDDGGDASSTTTTSTTTGTANGASTTSTASAPKKAKSEPASQVRSSFISALFLPYDTRR
jgi:hypothetical protein